MSKLPKSVANFNIDLFGFTFGVKVLAAVIEQTTSEVHVHGKRGCGCELIFIQRCPHCHHMQSKPVSGGRASVQKKIVRCSNDKCRRKIKDKPVEQARCLSCRKNVSEKAIKLAHRVGDDLVLLSDKDRKRINGLRTPYGIRVVSVRKNVSVSQLMIRTSYQVVPDKHSALHFEAFREGMKRHQFAFEVEVTLAEEKAGLTLKHEHMGLLRLDADGTLVLSTFYSTRDLVRVPVPAVTLPDEAVKDMHTLMNLAFFTPVGSQTLTYDTPASAALWRRLTKQRDDQPARSLRTADEQEQINGLAAQLKVAIDLLSQEANKPKSKKKPAAAR